jgi:quercetin dioxygenase-like cupin family protein
VRCASTKGTSDYGLVSWCLFGCQVWELVLPPGQDSGLHTHHYPYTFYVLNGSTLEVCAHTGGR